jgi:hypothetical protein
MEHMRVATYRLNEGTTFEEIAEAARGGMLDTFRLEPGFRRYEVADIGDGELISINLSGKIDLESNRVGDVAFTAE